MKIGWCHTLEEAYLIRTVGIDFLEIALATLELENLDTFATAKARIASCPVPIGSFRIFFPRDMTIVGPDVDKKRMKAYFARAAEILEYAGAKIVVAGSGWSRTIPEGWNRKEGEEQYVEGMSWAANALEGTGTTLVIEPLNRKETNFINSVEEGAHYVKLINRPQVRLLADFYHMNEEDDPLDTILAHGSLLAHVHLADTGRLTPGMGQYDYNTFFKHLKAINYSGALSVECKMIGLPQEEMRAGLAFIRRHWLQS